MTGGLGNDTFYVDSANDVVIEAVGGGTDTVKATASNYTLAANVENLTYTGASNFAGTGNTINNTITGGNGADTLDGNLGNDKLLGGLGNDQLLGGAGNDSLTGGGGVDIATGGIGADRFIFTTITDFASGAPLDLIADFSHAQADKIDVSGVDANSALSGDQAFTFIGAASFSSVTAQLRYAVSGADVIVSGDVNGDGIADFSFTVANTPSLVGTDFIL